MPRYQQKKTKPLTDGHCVGIIDAPLRVAHIRGDVSNASSFGYPVLYQSYPQLNRRPPRAETDDARGAAVKAVADMAARGVRGISANCGLLLAHRPDLARAAGVPLFVSALQLLPLAASLIGGRPVAIFTGSSERISKEALTEAGFCATNALHIVDLDDCSEYRDALQTEGATLDSDRLEATLVRLALNVRDEHQDLGAILLECPMLPPYSAALAQATGLPVFDQIRLIDLMQRATHRESFDGYF